MADQAPVQSSLDLVTIPSAGYAAYWLSVKRLMDKRGPGKGLPEDIGLAAEPYTRMLLETLGAEWPDETVRRMANFKKRAMLRDFRRKLGLIASAACAVAAAENPRKALITLAVTFGMPVLEESKAMEQAQGFLEAMRAGTLDPRVFPDVDHATRPDELILKLLFLLLWARREGKQSLQTFLPGVSSPYLAEALRLCIDGLDEPFIRRRLRQMAAELLLEASHKMDLGLELALALKARRPYEETLALARAFLLEG